VKPAPVDAGGAQGADAAHAQQKLLPDAHTPVAEVQPRGQLAVLLGIAVHVGVEQQELVASHVDLPDLCVQALSAQRHLDDQRLALPVQLARGGQVFLRRALVLGVLPTFGVDLLAEIRLPVEEPTATRARPRSDAVLTWSPANTPRPPL